MTDFLLEDRLLYLKSDQSTLVKFLLLSDREIVNPLEFYVLTSNTRRIALLLTGASDSLVTYYFCLRRDLKLLVSLIILIIIIITIYKESKHEWFGYCLRWDLHYQVVSFIDYFSNHHHHPTKRVCINGLAIVWGETFTFKLLVSLIIQIFIIIMVLQREYVWMAWGRTSIFKMLDAFIVLVIFIIVIVLRREYVWMSWLLSAACKTCFKSPQRSPSTSVVTVATWWSSSWLWIQWWWWWYIYYDEVSVCLCVTKNHHFLSAKAGWRRRKAWRLLGLTLPLA